MILHRALASIVAVLTAIAVWGVRCEAQGTRPTVPAGSHIIPAAGDTIPGMASFDSVVKSLMRTYQMPGASIAVVKDGRLVYARGFGWSDVEARVPVEPTALFRIASVSKPVTAAAIMKLVENGKLRLTDSAFAYLRDLTPLRGIPRNPHLDAITIEMLLQHRGGWNRDVTFDPMFDPVRIALEAGEPAPASAETIIRYMLGQPLQREPGTAYSYSNFGYAVLGRIIERVTGRSYEEYVRSEILIPAGASGMRIGRTQLAARADGEVKYYAIGGEPFAARMAASVFQSDGTVPRAYGEFHLEAMDSHGGWIASAIDLARFITAVDGNGSRPDVLSPESVERMVPPQAFLPPPLPPVTFSTAVRGASLRAYSIAELESARLSAFFLSSLAWYANGWIVRPAEGGLHWWHDGTLPGTAALIARAPNGVAWVALFNARAKNSGFDAALEQGLRQAVGRVTDWPAGDLFARYQ